MSRFTGALTGLEHADALVHLPLQTTLGKTHVHWVGNVGGDVVKPFLQVKPHTLLKEQSVSVLWRRATQSHLLGTADLNVHLARICTGSMGGRVVDLSTVVRTEQSEDTTRVNSLKQSTQTEFLPHQRLP